MAQLLDDGTMDTVIRCERCGQVTRFTYQPDSEDVTYDGFVSDCLYNVDNGCDHCQTEITL